MEEYGVQRSSLVNNEVKLWIPQTAGHFFQDEYRKGRLSRNIANSDNQRRITSQKSADPIRPRSKPEIIQSVSSLRVYQLLNQEKINAFKL